MKFSITFKTPDAIDDAVERELRQQELLPESDIPMNDDDQDKCELTRIAMTDCAELFVQYGEYVTIEFDTATKSATVLKVK